MRLSKIALWVFVALLISGIMFGVSLASDVERIGGMNNVFNLNIKGKVSLGFGTPYTVDEYKEADLTGIRRIQIDMSSADTTIFASKGQKVTASMKGEVRTTDPAAVPKLHVEVKGDTLHISEIRTAIISGSYSSNLKMDITLPDTFNGDLIFNGSSSRFVARELYLNAVSINTSSGDIQLGTVSTAADFTAKSSSGEFSIDHLSADNILVESTSGDKHIKNITADGKVSFSASSGETTVDRLVGSQVTIQTSSGDIKLGSVSAEFARLSGASATIRIDTLEGGCEVKNSSGDVTVNCANPTDKINLSTTSGRVQLSLPESSGFSLEANTSSGNIDSALRLSNGEFTEKHLSGTYNGGGIDVRIATSSGDISIKKY